MSLQIKVQGSFTLITGATSSIGKAVARRCAKNENLLLHGRDAKALAELASEIGNTNEIKIWCRDFGKLDGLNEEFLKILDQEGIQVTKVVHAAGYLKILPFRSFKLQDTMNIFSINVLSIIEILRGLACKPHREHLTSVVMISAFFQQIRGQRQCGLFIIERRIKQFDKRFGCRVSKDPFQFHHSWCSPYKDD